MIKLSKFTNRILNIKPSHLERGVTRFNSNSSAVITECPQLTKPKHLTHSYSVADNKGVRLLCDTVGERVDVLASTNPGDVAYKFCLTQQGFTFLEVKQRTDEIAQNLLNMGFKKADRMAILLPNIPQLNLTLLACAQIGVIAVLMNPAYQKVEVEYMLKKTGAKGIVMLDNLKTLQHFNILKEICPELPTSVKGELNSAALPDLKHVIIANNGLMKDPNQGTAGTWNWSELTKFDKTSVIKPAVDMNDDFVIMFTSGTTGLPKGAVLSHHNLINSAYLEITTSMLIEENRIVCCPIPVFHIFGLIVGATSPLIYGGKAVFPSFFPDPNALIKAIESEKCTSIKAAPVIYMDLLNHPDFKKHDLNSLKTMLVGASTVPKDLLVRLRKDIPSFTSILSGIGMTETTAAGLINRPNDINISERYGYESLGQSFPFTECKIIDEDGSIVPHDTDGELCFKGYNIMKGYWDEPVKTAETIDKNGWLKTGDIASMDENGYVFFKSRAKEVIIRGGVNIYPAEIEVFMRSHDDVMDCYCFSISDKRVDEEVCVWIKLRPGSQLTKEDVLKFCEGKIAFFKVPKHIKFVDAFPISANGKAQKFKMADQMLKELEAQ